MNKITKTFAVLATIVASIGVAHVVPHPAYVWFVGSFTGFFISVILNQ